MLATSRNSCATLVGCCDGFVIIRNMLATAVAQAHPAGLAAATSFVPESLVTAPSRAVPAEILRRGQGAPSFFPPAPLPTGPPPRCGDRPVLPNKCVYS